MTTSECIQFVLEVKTESLHSDVPDEAAASEVALLVSGSFTYTLYESLRVRAFDLDAILEHLEALYDSGSYIGFVYFTFILANAAEIIVPIQFSEMSANDALAPILSAAIIEDWLEYHAMYEETQIQ